MTEQTCGDCIYCVKSEGKPYYCAIKDLYHFVDANKMACEEFRGLDEVKSKPRGHWR